MSMEPVPPLWGAYLGDYCGSTYEVRYDLERHPALTPPGSRFTDDSMLTYQIHEDMEALARLGTLSPETLARRLHRTFRQRAAQFPEGGFSRGFTRWALQTPEGTSNDSAGNGAVMRLSAVGHRFSDPADAHAYARAITEVSHNHPEALQAAAALTDFVLNANSGMALQPNIHSVRTTHGVPVHTWTEIRTLREGKRFVRQALPTLGLCLSLLEQATGFEDALELAIWYGGDTDTQGAVLGQLAEPYHPIPPGLAEAVRGPFVQWVKSLPGR